VVLKPEECLLCGARGNRIYTPGWGCSVSPPAKGLYG
jgi:hypothetical protein